MSFSYKPKAFYNILLRLNSVLFICALFMGCNPDKKNLKQNVNNDLAEMNLRGQVESVIYHSYKTEFGEFKKTKNYRDLYFNEEGNWIRYTDFRDDGKLFEKITYKYDDADKLVEMNKYDPENNLKSKIKYKYNKKGDLKRKFTYKPDGSLKGKSRMFFTYNNKDQVVEKTTVIGWKDIYNVELFKYYKDGNIKELDDPDRYKVFYTYTDGDRIKNRKRVFKNGKTNESVYKYDENGNVIQILNYSETSSIKKRETKYVYKYDEYGNWIEKIISRNNEKIKKTSREIEYGWEWF